MRCAGALPPRPARSPLSPARPAHFKPAVCRFIDLLAGGRLKCLRDLSDYVAVHSGLDGTSFRPSLAMMRSLVIPLDGADVCMQLMREQEVACLRSNEVAQAAFWKSQRRILREHLGHELDGEDETPG